MEQIKIRKISSADNAALAVIIRKNLESYHLDIPGTAYFDSNVDHLSDYYDARPATSSYFVLVDEKEQVLGGMGFEKIDAIENCAELQKLYLKNEAKGKGYGKILMAHIEAEAKKYGFAKVYLETHSNLREAVCLYQGLGYKEIPKPDFVVHTTMDIFLIKDI